MKYFEVLKAIYGIKLYKIISMYSFSGSQGTGDFSVWSVLSVSSGPRLLYTIIVTVQFIQPFSTIYAAV